MDLDTTVYGRWLLAKLRSPALREWLARHCSELQPKAHVRGLLTHAVLFIAGLLIAAPFVAKTSAYDGWFIVAAVGMLCMLYVRSICVLAMTVVRYIDTWSGTAAHLEQSNVAEATRATVMCLVAGTLCIVAVGLILLRSVSLQTNSVHFALPFTGLLTVRASIERGW